MSFLGQVPLLEQRPHCHRGVGRDGTSSTLIGDVMGALEHWKTGLWGVEEGDAKMRRHPTRRLVAITVWTGKLCASGAICRPTGMGTAISGESDRVNLERGDELCLYT